MIKRIIILGLLLAFPSITFAQNSTDVTSKIETIGNPAKAKWDDANTACHYARNVWDMQNFLGKLYIGSGNSSNEGPCTNAGPIPVFSFNPSSNTFSTEYTVDSEQIDIFKVLNFGGTQGTQLVIPSHDPRSDNAIAWFGLRAGTWRKHQGVYLGLPTHTYDFSIVGDKIIAGTALIGYIGNTADVNEAGGEQWTYTTNGVGKRGYSTFVLGGVGYFAGPFQLDNLVSALYSYAGGTSSITKQSPSFTNMFPNTNISEVNSTFVDKIAKIYRPTNFQNSLVYIGAGVVNDHQADPFGLYKMNQLDPTTGADFSSIQKITLPNNAIPYDILIGSNGKIYVLGSIINQNRYWVTVSSSTDLTSWLEEFRFDSPTFARSFEQVNDDWYFGLGTTTTALSLNSGDVIKYAPVVASPSPTKTGDIDKNGAVDIFDFNQLLTDFGYTWGIALRSDLDNNNKVDIFDYNLLLTNFGK